jgi:hypothetical protein
MTCIPRRASTGLWKAGSSWWLLETVEASTHAAATAHPVGHPSGGGVQSHPQSSGLAIPAAGLTNDDLLTTAIASVTARFDKETNRTLARAVSATHEFDAADTEILPPLYPIETVTKWETKSSEAEGWRHQPTPGYLIRAASVISLASVLHSSARPDPAFHPHYRPHRQNAGGEKK